MGDGEVKKRKEFFILRIKLTEKLEWNKQTTLKINKFWYNQFY